MNRLFNKCMLILLSGMLTLLGFGSCKTTKISKKQRLRQEQAYRDSVMAAEQRAVDEARRRKMIEDSLRIEAERRDQQKAIYAGPNMMDRRSRVKKPVK